MHKSVPSLSCRLCGQVEETVVHFLSACPVLALTAYLHCHNLIADAAHWHLMKAYLFPGVIRSLCSHKPDFSLFTEHPYSSNHPDIVMFDYCKKQI